MTSTRSKRPFEVKLRHCVYLGTHPTSGVRYWSYTPLLKYPPDPGLIVDHIEFDVKDFPGNRSEALFICIGTNIPWTKRADRSWSLATFGLIEGQRNHRLKVYVYNGFEIVPLLMEIGFQVPDFDPKVHNKPAIRPAVFDYMSLTGRSRIGKLFESRVEVSNEETDVFKGYIEGPLNGQDVVFRLTSAISELRVHAFSSEAGAAVPRLVFIGLGPKIDRTVFPSHMYVEGRNEANQVNVVAYDTCCVEFLDGLDRIGARLKEGGTVPVKCRERDQEESVPVTFTSRGSALLSLAFLRPHEVVVDLPLDHHPTPRQLPSQGKADLNPRLSGSGQGSRWCRAQRSSVTVIDANFARPRDTLDRRSPTRLQGGSHREPRYGPLRSEGQQRRERQRSRPEDERGAERTGSTSSSRSSRR